uniref:RRM domain-containing protein n=2 Tax=Chenopodium quinoa TaxID=63459 RepID=A0A803LZQ8_CHEQI
WLENRPRGFGEGKVYDTSVEDKLLEEIEQSFKAQLSNITKLKNEGKKPKPKNDPPEVLFNASEGVPGGIRVRISNLPKKRNIHRDLKSAFEGVSGIIKISPVNSGNKKTRDPVCKGLAYVDFKSLADANRFIQMFSGQNISFGKSEKPIKCEILKPLDGSYEGSSDDGYNSTSEGNFLASEEEEDEDVDVEQIETALQFREDDDYVYEELVKSIKALDSQNVLGDLLQLSASERLKQVEMLEAKLLARASLNEVKSPKKKSEVKKKPDKKPNQKSDKDPNLKLEKKPKQRIPGSAKKLKVKEKAKLADVFARYGTRGASASKEK